MKENENKIKRLEEIIYSMAYYLTELNDEFLDYKHNKIVFGITKQEHNKYFLDEETKYKHLYNHLNFNLDYRITHKNLKNALKELQKQLNNACEQYLSVYEFLNDYDGEELINIFMEKHI